MKKVLVAGELNVDLVLQGYQASPEPGKEVLVDDFVMVLGSASAICAMGLARLDVPVAFLGKAGADPWGRFCIDGLSGRLGLTTSLDPGFDPTETWAPDLRDTLSEVDLF